jgi:thiosulfate/3-mercaptopyruvate sulfurtransferase
LPAQEQDTSIRAYRYEVVAAIGRVNLVDVRSPDEFAGRLLAPAHLPQEQAQRGGHIPTAKNVPWSKAAAEDGTFKTDEALRADAAVLATGNLPPFRPGPAGPGTAVTI